jgi:hypothetical protein
MAVEQADMWRHTGSTYAHREEGAEINIRVATIGTPKEIKESVDEYVAAGADHVEIGFIYPRHDELLEQMALFAETVMPEYR